MITLFDRACAWRTEPRWARLGRPCRKQRLVSFLVFLGCINSVPSVGAQPPHRVSSSVRSPGVAGVVLGGEADEDLDGIVLYQLRDRVFRKTTGGRRATQLFYAHLDDIAAASLAEPSLFGLARDWLLSWQGALRALVAGEGSATTLTRSHVDSLREYVEALAEAGGPALREALEREQGRLGLASWPGMTLDEWLQGPVNRLSCDQVDGALCLSENRFRVEAEWLDSEGNAGRGQGAPLGDDSGYFWFFGPDNIELIVKVLDACYAPFDGFWVFVAGLTNVDVRLTVTDTATGAVQEYRSSLGTPYRAIQDTAAFATCGGQPRDGARADLIDQREDDSLPPSLVSGAPPLLLAPPIAGGALCPQRPTSLCLGGRRFQVEVDWTTPAGVSGRGQARGLTADSGTFWFFDSDNVEVVVKVLDACTLTDRFWIFAAGLTNLEIVLRVTDIATGAVREYRNPQGTAFEAIQDLDAFATCS